MDLSGEFHKLQGVIDPQGLSRTCVTFQAKHLQYLHQALQCSDDAVLLLVLVPLASAGLLSQPLDCADVYNAGSNISGVYKIYPAGPTSPLYVYCDMETDGGKWTVFQRRMDGTVNFYRGWDQYKRGFGHAGGEYWLGLETIHILTLKQRYELRVDMEDFQGAKVHAKYSSFSISPQMVNAESDGYTLHVSGFEDGGAGDSLSYHSEQKFSTFDRDQDSNSGNCAVSYLGGFWYEDCHYVNPNGIYMWDTVNAQGVCWYHWKSNYYSMKAISMKIRPAV
uniref:Microfibril associated protein 4 n=1 Tax=Paramormyrops kingsleyae TaxID=1676925 RepID=A0A3B3R8J2_9TELE